MSTISTDANGGLERYFTYGIRLPLNRCISASLVGSHNVSTKSNISRATSSRKWVLAPRFDFERDANVY